MPSVDRRIEAVSLKRELLLLVFAFSILITRGLVGSLFNSNIAL